MDDKIEKTNALLVGIRSLISEGSEPDNIQIALYTILIQKFIVNYLPYILSTNKFTISNEDIQAMQDIFIRDTYSAEEYYNIKSEIKIVNEDIYFSMNDFEEILCLKDCEAEIENIKKGQESPSLLEAVRMFIQQCTSSGAFLLKEQLLLIEGFLFGNAVKNFTDNLNRIKDDLIVQEEYEIDNDIIDKYFHEIPPYEEYSVQSDDYENFRNIVSNINMNLFKMLLNFENMIELEACKSEIHAAKQKSLSTDDLVNQILGNLEFKTSYDSRGISATVELGKQKLTEF